MEPPGLRERKKRRTRQAIVEAAMSLFAEHGYRDTTVDGIAAAAGVSPRTFFRYFPAKEEVVLDGFEAELARWEAAFRAVPSGESLGGALRQATLVVNRDYEADRAGFDERQRLIAAEPALARRAAAFDAAAQERAAALIAEALEMDPATDLRPRVVAAAAMGAVRVAVEDWTRDPRGRARSGAVEEAYAVLTQLGGLLAHPISRGAGT